MKRAVYYVARLISSQKEKEFYGDNYNGLKKVYSIWIRSTSRKGIIKSKIRNYHLKPQMS